MDVLKLAILLLIPFAAQGQFVTGGHTAKGGNTIFTVAQGGITPTGAAPLSNAPIASTCSSDYKGIYQLGLYHTCTNTPPTTYDTDLKAAIASITKRSTSGTPCSTSGCNNIFMCGGMSIALIECQGLISAVGSLSNVRISNQAVSNNDMCTWESPALWATGVQPDCCLPSYNQCVANGLSNPPSNFGDKICTGLISSGLNCLQVQSGFFDQANGTGHQYMRGSVQSGCGTSAAIYYNAPPLDGTHTIDNQAFDGFCTVNYPNDQDATNMEAEWGNMFRAIKARMPNFIEAIVTGRITASACTIGCANPEPQDFEVSLSLQDLVYRQQCELGDWGCTAGTIDANAGDLCPLAVSCGGASVANSVPFIVLADVQPAASSDGQGHSSMFWGVLGIPQLTDSTNVWCAGPSYTPGPPCNGEQDYGSDYIHLNSTGEAKAGGLLQRFLVHSPYTRTFFF